MEPAHTLIIGYGSPIRGDDAIGPLAAEALAEAGLPPGVKAIPRHILTAELVPDIAAASRVVFLDASLDGAPGQVRVLPLEPDALRASTMSHSHDPRELLAWCDLLYGRVPQAWLIAATGTSFDYAHCKLSRSGRRAMAAMLSAVRSMLATGSPAAHPRKALAVQRGSVR